MVLINLKVIRTVSRWLRDRKDFKDWRKRQAAWLEALYRLELEDWIRVNPEFITAEVIAKVIEDMAAVTARSLQEEKLAVLLEKTRTGTIVQRLEAELQAYSCLQAFFCDLMASRAAQRPVETENER